MSVWGQCLVCAGPLYACTCPQMAPPGPHLPPSTGWYGYWYGYDTKPDAPALEHDPERFPHKCEHCGKWCYVSNQFVEHEHGAECK